MGKRDALFVGIVLGGVSALVAGLFPYRLVARPATVPAREERSDDFDRTVTAVNAAFARQWADQRVTPAPHAPELAVMRRISLALTGSIPSLQDLRQFENQPVSEGAGAWLESLLRDRRYANYIAERLARSYVGNEDGPFIVYRRRRFVTWLSDQLLQNRPYDDLVRELIAAQGLWTDKPATNFVTVTIQPDNKKGPDAERLAARVTRAFLGIRLDCAQCHNHPFQPWKQADFQGLAAFFGQVHQGFTGIYDGDGEYEVENRKTLARETIPPGVPFQPELLADGGTRRQKLAEWVTSPQNPWFARATVNRVWALLFAKPLVEPVDDLASAAEMPPVLELLAEDFRTHGHDLQRLIRLIAATDVFQLDSAAGHELTEVHEQQWAAFPMNRLRPEQIIGSIQQAASVETLTADSHILVRIGKAIGESDFVKRYGDMGEDEFDGRGGTIPQRLLLMNGEIVKDKTKGWLLNASTRIALMAPDDRAAVASAYLAVLTRRPTPEEDAHFQARLGNSTGGDRRQRMEDLFWVLINSTEFSWNH